MIQRCTNPLRGVYADYGGRGINVCERWLESFESFYADMGPRPSLKHSVDRFPNQSGNYEPGNCRWATAKEQAQNMRSNRIVILDGESMCVTEAAARVGMPMRTLRNRLLRGIPINEAIRRTS